MRNNIAVRLMGVFALVLSIFVPCRAAASDATLVGDAHISSSHPATNFGNVSNLHVGNSYQSLLQFDLQPALPAGTTADQIAQASLVLYVNRVNQAGAIDLQPVTSSWSESSV